MKTTIALVICTIVCATAVAGQGSVQWEYGQLRLSNGTPISWTAGDSLVMDTRDALAVVARMDSVLYGKGGRRSRDRESTNARIVLHDSTGGASALQRTLNLLGAQGWELVAVQGETYFFKRRKS